MIVKNFAMVLVIIFQYMLYNTKHAVEAGVPQEARNIRNKPSVCGEVKNLKEDEGVFLSHSSAGRHSYPKNVLCTGVITGRPDRIVKLHFEYFELDDDEECRYDYLTVYDGPDDTASNWIMLCGYVTPDDYYSSGQSLTLRFRSDSARVSRGFKVRYKLHTYNYTKPTICGGHLTGDNGVIVSHSSFGQRKNYPTNMQCSRTITAPPGKVVKLHFETFSLESSGGCEADRLSVYDGPNTKSLLMKTLCHSKLPEDIYSSSRSLTLNFISDDDYVKKGFKISYKLVDKPTASTTRTASDAKSSKSPTAGSTTTTTSTAKPTTSTTKESTTRTTQTTKPSRSTTTESTIKTTKTTKPSTSKTTQSSTTTISTTKPSTSTTTESTASTTPTTKPTMRTTAGSTTTTTSTAKPTTSTTTESTVRTTQTAKPSTSTTIQSSTTTISTTKPITSITAASTTTTTSTVNPPASTTFRSDPTQFICIVVLAAACLLFIGIVGISLILRQRRRAKRKETA